MPEYLAFALLSVPIVFVSRRSLAHPRAHGFYRFFAWEFMLALLLLNYRWWFADPFSLRQIASWLLLIISLYLVIAGVRQLGKAGRAEIRPDQTQNLGFENTAGLVTTGVYRYIRHPMYSSLLGLAWGIFLKNITITGAALAILSSILIYITARIEEIENIRFFGNPYTAFKKHNKMFIPYIL